jgi:mono/diheme cytochrome c family protein
MKRIVVAAALLAALGTAGMLASRALASKPSASVTVERGRYLVEQVGMCADCHSPRLQTGEFDRSRWLMGAPILFTPSVPMPAWAPAAPALAGLETFTDKEAVRFLSTGLTQTDDHARPPMPEYRMSEEDARAVVAYLRSLPVVR